MNHSKWHIRHLFFRNFLLFCFLSITPFLLLGQSDQGHKSVKKLLKEFDEMIPYHLAYSETVLKYVRPGTVHLDPGISWKKNLTKIEAHLEARSRIVGDNLLLFPKKRFLLSGYIFDKSTGESLPGAHVWIDSQGRGTSSNDAGFFQLWLPEGTHACAVSYLGYQSQNLSLEMNANQLANFHLDASLDLPEIVVEADDTDIATHSASEKIPLSQMQDLPSLGATMDIARHLQFIPGITTGGDGLGGLHVRGGNADQNLVLLDDIPIYNPFHLFGISSVFNGYAMQKANLSKSYFSPQHMGRLSSVLDITMRDGHRHNTTINASLGLMSIQGTIETPIFNKGGTLMLSGQKSLMGGLVRSYSSRQKSDADVDGYSRPDFWDFNGKMMVQLNPSNKLILNTYLGGDHYRDLSTYFLENPADTSFRDQYRDEYNWGNWASGLKWLHDFNGRSFLDINIYHSRYEYNSLNGYTEQFSINNIEQNGISDLTEFQSSIRENGMKIHLSLLSGYDHQIKTGIQISAHHYIPGIIAYQDINGGPPSFDINRSLPSFGNESFDTLNFKSQQISLFFEDQWKINTRWEIKGGLSATYFRNKDDNFFSLQPRFQVSHRIGPSRVALSFNKLLQAQHLITTNDNGLPNELWVPATRKIAPETSYTADISWDYLHPSGHSQITSKVYYKKMQNLVAFRDDPGFLNFGPLDNIDASIWEEDIITGSGESWGIENSYHRQWEKWSAGVHNTFAKSSRLFSDKNLGFKVPYEYEVPHVLSLQSIFHLNAKWHFGLTWQLSSGTRYNLNPGYYDLYDRDDFLLEEFDVLDEEIELLVMPTYHRLDLTCTYKIESEKSTHLFKVSLLNVYNNLNVLFPRIYPSTPITDIRLSEGLPFIPSLSYNFSLH